MSARRSARTPADDDGVGHAEAGAGPSGAQGGDPLADQLAAILSAIDGLTQQVRATVTNDEERQAAIALLEHRLEDLEGSGGPGATGTTANSGAPAASNSCIRCLVRPKRVDADGREFDFCGRYCADRAGQPLSEDDDDRSTTSTIRPAPRHDPDARRFAPSPAFPAVLPSRTQHFRHPYGEGPSGSDFRIANQVLETHVRKLSEADAVQFRDSLALFVRWEHLVALVQESLQPTQVQEFDWMWDAFQNFDAHFKSHVDAFLIAAAHEGAGSRALAFKAYQPDSAGASLYNTERARELHSKKQTRMFEEHGRRFSGTKKDDDDAPPTKRGSRGGARGQGAAGGGARQQRQNSQPPTQQQQQQQQQQQRSASRESRGRQGQGRGGGAAGGGAAKGSRGNGSQGGAGGGGAPAPPP
jgi:hypothetical protein